MNNKKIGILTFHQALSYGAKLQAYALQTFMNNNGIENEIIDYTCPFMYSHLIRPIRFGKTHKTKAILRSFLTMRQTGIDRRKSVAFRTKYMKLSRPFNEKNISEAKDEYAAFIAGSDQVWSPVCVGGDPVYFLNFALPEQKYSYAASIGEKELVPDKAENFKNLLSDFQRFSVREESAAAIIKNLLGRESTINVDPTLLLKAEEWDKIAAPVKNINPDEPYIFLFNVKTPKNLFAYAKRLGKKTGCKIYSIQKNRRNRVKGVNYLDPVTANEFVWLIKNARYVVTNSFHGTAFSIIYKKDYAIEFDYLGGRNNRSEELMTDLGISGREITASTDPNPESPVDWDSVEKKLAIHRQSSLDYLNTVKKDVYGL